jgi:hypothetical protein
MGGSYDVTDVLCSSASDETHTQALHSDTHRTPSHAGELWSLGGTMTIAKGILFSVVALVVGGLAGAWLGRSNMGKGERKREAINTYATTLFLSEQIELLNRSDVEKAKVNLNHQLAIYALKAESLAKKEDDAGFIAKKALKMVANQRTTPAYLEEEKAVKLLSETPIDPVITR